MAHKLTMYENLQDMVERELGEIERKGDINKENLDNLYKLAMIERSLLKKIMVEKGMEDGGYSMGYHGSNPGGYSGDYSYRMPPMMRSYDQHEQWGNSRGMSYDNYSQARAGRDADNDGRYHEGRSHDYSRENSYGSYDGQMSRDASKKRMAQKLATLMDDTMSEKERIAIQECIEKIQK